MTYLKSRRFIGAAFTAITMLSITRTITGNGDLTSTVTIAQALVFASPIALAGLAGIWAERAGVINIGLEGMMILGTFGAGWAGCRPGHLFLGCLRPLTVCFCRCGPLCKSGSGGVGVRRKRDDQRFVGCFVRSASHGSDGRFGFGGSSPGPGSGLQSGWREGDFGQLVHRPHRSDHWSV